MIRRLLALGLILLLSGAVLSPAAAGGTKDRGDARTARDRAKLRQEGETALANKEYAAAGRAFTELYRQTLQPEGLYLLGLLAHAEGRLLDAQDLLRRFLSDSRFEPTKSAAEVTAAQRILALPRPPNGKVSISGERGALVTVDGRVVGALPLARPLLVAPGRHTLAIADGARRQQEEIDIALGRFLEVAYARSSAALLSSELAGVLVFEQYPGLPKEAAAPLGQAVEDALQGEQLSPFPLALALTQAGQPSLSACIAALDCQLQLARSSELDYVLAVQLGPSAAHTPWQLQLALIDVEVGQPAAQRDLACAECDAAKASALLASQVPALLGEARRRTRGTLDIKSNPPGAEVRWAGRTLGTTPLVQPMWSGSLELEVTLTGYLTQRLPVAVSSGQTAELNVTLAPDIPEPGPAPLVVPPVVPRAPAQRPRFRLALGGVALGAGALLLGFGAGALYANGKCIDTPADPNALCNQLYSTAGLGTGLVIGGGALLVSGVVLLSVPPRQPPSHPTEK